MHCVGRTLCFATKSRCGEETPWRVAASGEVGHHSGLDRIGQVHRTGYVAEQTQKCHRTVHVKGDPADELPFDIRRNQKY